MKKYLLTGVFALAGVAGVYAEDSYWTHYGPWTAYDRAVIFDQYAQDGTYLPIMWGFDTAWNDEGNMLRGVRHAGAENVGVVRVSFQPWAQITTKGVLPARLKQNLESRLKTVGLVGHPVDIALNLDGGENTVKDVYGGLDSDNNYVGDKASAAYQYALLIDATVAELQAKGYNVVSAAPFNEPDYFWNGTPIDVFGMINQHLKNESEFPRFKNIRISGGNTLNCDEALPWYTELKENLDEGNTHQLAGDFNHYADFFAQVRADGKYATADELHNVMEAMVGVEYGMQTGIWWGSATRTRGDFMKASSGLRLAYAENRDAWSSAAVYRHTNGTVEGFIGCSERQAKPSTFNFISRKGDFFVNGRGPLREYVASLPADPKGEYMTSLQRNAESSFIISTGSDIQPEIDGDYIIVNMGSHKVVSGANGSTADGTRAVQRSYTGTTDQHWTVTPVPEDIGGDFHYWYIRNTEMGSALDDNNWNMSVGGEVIIYGASNNAVQLWTMEYAGNGLFRIRNQQSGLYLDAADTADGTQLRQQEYAERDGQLWRFVRQGVTPGFTTPDVPAAPHVEFRSLTATVTWQAAAGMSYTMLRAAEDGVYNVIARGITVGEYHDNALVNGNVYSYKLMAEDESGNRSGLSEATAVECRSSEMIASFNFNENMDDESCNNFGVRYSGTPSYVAGRNDKRALYLNRAQMIQLPYNMLQGDEFSLVFWVMALTEQESKILFRTGMGEGEDLLLYPILDGKMQLVGTDGDVCTAESLGTNEWKHVAVVKNTEGVRLYVNGVAGEGLVTNIPADRVLSILGRGYNGLNDKFSGRLSDLHIYTKALSPDELVADMNGTAGVTEIPADTTLVNTEYYSIDGRSLSYPAQHGVTIVRRIYSDGSILTTREYIR